MNRTLAFKVAAVVTLVLAVAGCTDESPDASGAGSTPPTTSPTTPPTTSSTAPPVTTTVDPLANPCYLAGMARDTQTITEATALTAKTDSRTMRAKVAATYHDFAGALVEISKSAPTEQAIPLIKWATTAEDQAIYLLDHAPPHGVVMAYGPPQKQVAAAEKAVEKVCGGKLNR